MYLFVAHHNHPASVSVSYGIKSYRIIDKKKETTSW